MQRSATIVVDLGFGDAGKGSIVDYLTRQGGVSAIVRFNGGAQAAHNVHTSDGRHHTFSQWGSGTFVPGVETYLSRYMLFDPVALAHEAEHLITLGVPAPYARLAVDEDALVVTPFHKAANRVREMLRGSGRHGSCGMGIGETMADSITFYESVVRARDLRDPTTLYRAFRRVQERKADEFKVVRNEILQHPFLTAESRVLFDSDMCAAYADLFWRLAMRVRITNARYLAQLALRGNLVFEGAQGVLIDEWHGFHPYTTWSTATFDNALALLQSIGFEGTVQRLGVVRTYMTRHGAGPFPTEEAGFTLALPDANNHEGTWQGGWRVGPFDSVLTRYAIEACGGIDSLAVTHIDRMSEFPHMRIATAYDVLPLRMSERARAAVHTERNRHGTVIPNRIRSLKRKNTLDDLTYQELLTSIATHARPIYETAPRTWREYVRTLERELKTTVSIVSAGKTANDKYVLSDLATHRLAA